MAAALAHDAAVDELFELVVDSGFEGMRKPEPAIYELTLERLGLPARRARSSTTSRSTSTRPRARPRACTADATFRDRADATARSR